MASLKLSSPFEETFSSFENNLNIKTGNTSTGISYSHKRFNFYSSINLGAVNTTFSRENFISPLFRISYKKSVEKEISLKYEYIVRPVSLFEMRDFAYVKNQNTLSIGNPYIKPVKYHLFDFNYYLSDFASGITFFGKAVYLNYAQFVLTENQFENQKNTENSYSTNLDREELTLQIVLGKVLDKVKLNLSPQWNFSNYPQQTEKIEIRNKNSRIRLRLNGETLFKQFPNLKLSFTHTLNSFKNEFTSRDYNVSQISLGIFKNSKRITYGVNYAYSKSSNVLLDNIHHFSFKTIYNFPDSRWSVFVEAENLLEESFYTSQFVTDIAITEQQISRIPRNIIAGISFKF